MTQLLSIQCRFGYRSLHLVKSEDNSLGIGSYGAVYKARCDQLPCAAKVLHPILFSTRDPASRRIVERFEQECQFLSGMRHPNIIQYLGTCRDPESGLPVLLMELMDYSLTSFLEQPDDPPPLPFHIQVDISLDVAQALAYLHSNEVLHRDLSSNNVLLIGSCRAKVTDFGMARAAGPNPRLTATYCPGTMGYMSPEALQEPPAYTTKLDIFSCGVLHIQIITRKFPDPGPRMHRVEVNDPRFPLGRVEVPVPERDRRRSHIDLIDPTHPLLRIALDCLKDEEGERPSAEQLCSCLAALKEAPRYQESLQQAQQADQSLHEGTEAQPELLQQIQELRQQLEEREETVQAKEREVDGLMRSMEQLRLQSQEKKTQIQRKERDINQLRDEVRQKDEQVQQLEKEMDSLVWRMEQLRLQSQEKETQFQQKEREIHQKDEQVQQLRRELHQTSRDSEQLVATLQHSLEQKDDVIRSKDAALQEKEKQIEISDSRVPLGQVEMPVPEREHCRSHIDLTEPQTELLQQNQELRQQLEEREETVQAKEREVDGLVRNMEQLRLEKETQIQEKERDNHRLQGEVCQKDEQVQQLRQEFHQTRRDSEQLVATLQHSLEQKDEVIRSKDEALQEKERQIRELRQSQGDKTGNSTAAQPLRLQWRRGPKAPLATFGESSAVHGRVAYFYSWKEKKIMMYNSGTGKWAILPECPKREFSIAIVNGLLTAIGGRQSPGLKDTKTLLSLKTSRELLGHTEQQTWAEQFPPMTYYHNGPAVACTSTSLIVAGGWGPHEKRAPVEVMDTNTLCWSTAASLPHPWKQATAAICRERIYMAGGFVKGDVETNSVLTCVVSELLQLTATQCQSLGARPTAASGLQPSTDSHKVWQEAAPLPEYWSSLVTLHGRLLAVGGCDLDDNLTSAVYQYDTATNSWKVISHMSTKRYHCFPAVLPDNTLLVAGGALREHPPAFTDSVEIASCV